MIKDLLLLGGVAAVFYMFKNGKSKKVDPVKLDELAQKYSDDCDRMILKELENPDLTYVSGLFRISLAKDQRILLRAEFYFKNASGEWVKKATERTISSNHLYQVDLAELKDKGEIKYELEAPQQELESSVAP